MTRIAPPIIRGLNPALDARSIDRPYVLDGRNFLFGTTGPRTGFGRKLTSYDKIVAGKGVATFRVEDRSYLFLDDGIFDFDPVSGLYFPIFIFSTPIGGPHAYPWSSAFVNDTYYFARRDIGIIVYNSTTQIWSTYTDPFLPADPRSVADANGRLIILCANAIVTSALDDGQNITPSIELGVNIQTLSALIGKSDAFAVFKSVNGFIVFTDKGFIRAVRSESVIPFRFLDAVTSHAPINPFSVVGFDEEDKQIFLDKKGLHTIQRDLPEPYDNIFNEFLRNELLPSLPLGHPDLVRLHYAADQQLMIVSHSFSQGDTYYGRAFVQYIPREDWGVFNSGHLGFGEAQLNDDPDVTYQLSVFDQDGDVYAIDSRPYIETRPIVDYAYYFAEYNEIPARDQDGELFMPDSMHIGSGRHFPYLAQFGITSYFVLSPLQTTPTTIVLAVGSGHTSEDVAGELIMRDMIEMDHIISLLTYTLAAPVPEDLDAYIVIGLYRVLDQETEDRMTNISEVAVYATPGQEDVIVDYLELFGEEDWNNLEGFEDWGKDAAVAGYDTDLIATVDGKTAFAIYELDIQTKENQATIYAADAEGIWHQVKIKAPSLFQSFHLNSLVLDGRVSSRY